MTNTFSRSDITLSNWRLHPHTRWSFQRVHEFVPVSVVTRGQDEPVASSAALKEMRLATADGSLVSATEHLTDTYTDSFVAMREGAVVAEWHREGIRQELPHIVFSVSKSITGMLAGIAAGDGMLDPQAFVSSYVPEVDKSAYATARVRDLLDMTVSLDFDESYLDADGAFDRYRRATLWNPQSPSAEPSDLLSFLCTLQKGDGEHGKRFFYASPNTDMLGIVLERATGTRFADYLRSRLWLPMGAKGAASVTVDRLGAARAAGGISVTARDLARLGQLMLDRGQARTGLPVVPADWIVDMRQNGNRDAWVQGNFAATFPQGRYRSCWYDTGDGRGTFAAIGIHEQWLWCDPVSRIVIAKFSSRPEPSDEAASQREIDLLGQIARVL
ncbi:serine hydrolase [Mesorhizobium sp. NBSH29]|uniref:serine hydrolase domain-containing protein n=1 Tax=Mesorhizobium sp. NBSH29 TaxID=2654249 RepID=UPI0018966E9E|nr:serine hydrolase [Mesorhizobium sp. NBSH29]QPC87258.1 serine hydrolase [Mesorhizobium sp. NBSH29]